MIGTQLNGRFRLEERLGAGGMSIVYKAFDETLERWVAIKLLHREITSEADQLERFRREARAVARLSSPHVVTVIDAGEDDDGTPYIVFEYVEGETLKERIHRVGPLPIPEAVAYAIEIGWALSAAHAERLVHRDVKPQNVLISTDGRAKVTDFGIARSLEVHGLTATGRVLGTTDYVSPEQALGEPVTQQSDVYSLGIVLYEMLAGRTPYRADTQVGVAMKHVREPLPDVRASRPQVSSALAAVVERATAKELRNRYATAGDMVEDLEQALGIEAARAGEATGEASSVLQGLQGDTADFAPLRLRRPRRRVLAVLAAVLVTAGVAAGVYARGETGKTGGAEPVTSPGGLSSVSLTGASDFDPAGDGTEHPEEVQNAVDGIRSTQWTSERYEDGALADKPGVGLAVEAATPVAARRLSLVNPLPGWEAEVWATTAAEPPPRLEEGWTRVARRTTVGEVQRLPLQTRGRPYRHYLVWVVGLGGRDRAEISELTLQG